MKVHELGLPIVAKILSWGEASQAPEYFTTSPSKAIPIALKRANLTQNDVDYFEINEGFFFIPSIFFLFPF